MRIIEPSVEKVTDFVNELYEDVKLNHADILENIRVNKVISDELSNEMKEVMNAFVEKFLKVNKEG